MGSSFITFGLVIYLPDTWMIITAAIILRIIEGFASSMMKIMGYSIIISMYPDEKIKYLGIMESAMGVGMATGPVIGAALYNFVKFTPTLLLIGGIIYLFNITMYIFTSSIKLEDKFQILSHNDSNEEKGLLEADDEELIVDQTDEKVSSNEYISSKFSTYYFQSFNHMCIYRFHFLEYNNLNFTTYFFNKEF